MTTFRWENESIEAQLAHDKFMSQALENKLNYEVKKDQELYQCHQYNKNGTSFSDIVYTMISENKVQAMYYKNEICLDVDICEAVDTACIKLGLPSEDYSPYLLDKGMMIEIYLQ